MELIEEIASEIKKDLKLENCGTPTIMSLNELIKELDEPELDALNVDGVINIVKELGCYPASSFKVNPETNSIYYLQAPIIFSLPHALISIFGKDKERVKQEDGERIALLFSLTFSYFRIKFNREVAQGPHLFGILELMRREHYDKLPERTVTGLVSLVRVLDEVLTIFHSSYLAKKTEELNEKYLEFLKKTSHLSKALSKKIDFTDFAKYFEPFSWCLQNFAESCELRLRGEYKGEMFAKSFKEYYKMKSPLANLFWMCGISEESKYIL